MEEALKELRLCVRGVGPVDLGLASEEFVVDTLHQLIHVISGKKLREALKCH